MQIVFKDAEIQYLIESGKSRKYKGLPDKKSLVSQLRYLYIILSALSDISELSNFKSIFNTLIQEADGSFLLPINSSTCMALRMSHTSGTLTLLELINTNNYEQGR